MSFFPPPTSPSPPVRCYEDGSCDPPGTTYNADNTKTFPQNPAGHERDAIFAGMQYGLDQRQQSPIPLRGLWGGG
jgi:hypothetical protein